MLRKIVEWKNSSRLAGVRVSERGQSFVELAISIVFLLTLLAAMIDLGWAYYTLTSLRDAAQEAAVYASMCPGVDNREKVIDRLQKSASAPLDISDIPADHISVCIVDPKNPVKSCADADPSLTPTLGYSMRVEVYVDHEIRTPFVASFIGTTTYPLRVDVSDTILRVDDKYGCE